ncbi:hypothetical protein KTE26_22105, partial [Ralstonia mannitolilytica]|uniref:hypothetical protein n=1 Tax=Ralstonia mannitolilytica TaxID=105219 RepID=UPI001C241D96
LSANAICASVNLLVFMACLPFQIVKIMPDSLLLSGTVSWCRVTDLPAEPSSTTTIPSTPLHEATGLGYPFDFDDF